MQKKSSISKHGLYQNIQKSLYLIMDNKFGPFLDRRLPMNIQLIEVNSHSKRNKILRPKKKEKQDISLINMIIIDIYIYLSHTHT